LVADVTDPAACEAMVGEAVAALGGIDGLVLNVGTNRGSWLDGTDPQLWDRLMTLNVGSHFYVVRAALKQMSDAGSVVFIGSGAGLIPGSRAPAYDASKAALLGLCRHVAFEGSRQRIRANLVVPGLVDTPLGREIAAGRPTRGKVFLPLGRQATPWEIAYATIFLLGDESSYVTGQMLVVDGGVTWMR
jgi:NAD(P)-dependent dehydrogenase (short-subunit alcohol dehydrogenase family)